MTQVHVDLFVESAEEELQNNEANVSMTVPDLTEPVVGDANGKCQINCNVVGQMYPILARFYSDECHPNIKHYLIKLPNIYI